MKTVRILATVLALAAIAPSGASAQGSCNYSGFGGNCVLGDNTTYAINLTITRAVRLALSASSIALDAPMPDDYDAGFGQTVGPVLTVKANSSWSVSIRTTQSTWTASPAPARPNKPASELRWATSPAGPFTNFTTTAVTVRTGTASAGTAIPLHFRVAYAWLLDRPGTYSIPVQVTVTSP